MNFKNCVDISWKIQILTILRHNFYKKYYRHSSYNAVLLYRGILSNAVFSKPKIALEFYLTRFFHKQEGKKIFDFFQFSKFFFDMQKKSLRKHLNLLLDYICTIIYWSLLEMLLFCLESYLDKFITFFIEFCSKSGLWK